MLFFDRLVLMADNVCKSERQRSMINLHHFKLTPVPVQSRTNQQDECFCLSTANSEGIKVRHAIVDLEQARAWWIDDKWQIDNYHIHQTYS